MKSGRKKEKVKRSIDDLKSHDLLVIDSRNELFYIFGGQSGEGLCDWEEFSGPEEAYAKICRRKSCQQILAFLNEKTLKNCLGAEVFQKHKGLIEITIRRYSGPERAK